MRPSNKSRSRNKPGNNGGGQNNNNNNNQQRRSPMGNIINRVFESAGPDGKVRGTPQQIIDKYQALARDAQVAGDRVAAESYLQYSEHYSRLLGEAQRQQQETRFTPDGREEVRAESQDEEGGSYDQQRRPQQQPQPQPQHQPMGQQQPQHQPQSQPMNQPPVASGLAMIEPEDSYDMSGPVDTPENRRPRTTAPAPVAENVVIEMPHSGNGRQPGLQPQPDFSAPAPAPAVASEAELPATTDPVAEQADAAGATPAVAPAPKRRRRPRAEAPAPTPAPAEQE